jgi:tRNA (guanine10-N2)-methyltransferase
MKKYLIHFAQFHLPFRLPELDSLAKLEFVDLRYNPKDYSDDCPFLIVELENDEEARKLIQRSILVKEIIELWACGATMEELFANMRKGEEYKREMYKTCSFKFEVDAFNYSLAQADKVDRINQFAWLDYQGPIELKNPDVVFSYFEDYSGEPFQGKKFTSPPSMLYFGVLLAYGNRSVVAQYDLKKRNYLGTTSMDAELSLIMANQALAQPGSLILDPFVGTGSFLVSCSHFGAFTLGADIDGRQIRGMDGKKGIDSNLEQYKLQDRVIGTVVCDMAHHPWRKGELFDAIVCDPPYGVRAGAKKIAPSDLPQYKKYVFLIVGMENFDTRKWKCMKCPKSLQI